MKKRIIAKISLLTGFIILTHFQIAFSFPISWDESPQQIWEDLQHTSSTKLALMQNESDEALPLGWITLALITKQKTLTNEQLVQQLLTWREDNPNHPANQLLPDNETLNQLQLSSRPKQIAVLLPQSGEFQAVSQSVRAGILNAYYKHGLKNQQRIKFYDTAGKETVEAVYEKAVTEGADMVIGPLSKNQVKQLSQQVKFTTPTLALNYSHQSTSLPTNYFEFGLLPEDEVIQLANRARNAGLKRAIVIAPHSAWGKRLTQAFSKQWSQLGGKTQAEWHFSNRNTFSQEIARLLGINIEKDNKLAKRNSTKAALAEQRRQDVDVIFLFANAQDARMIVPLLRYYYAGDIPVFANASVKNSINSLQKNEDLQGVTVCDIPQKNNTDKTNRMRAIGEDAYLLSQSLYRLAVLPNFPLYGSTGALSLSDKHEVHRRLPCELIQRG